MIQTPDILNTSDIVKPRVPSAHTHTHARAHTHTHTHTQEKRHIARTIAFMHYVIFLLSIRFEIELSFPVISCGVCPIVGFKLCEATVVRMGSHSRQKVLIFLSGAFFQIRLWVEVLLLFFGKALIIIFISSGGFFCE